MILKVNKYMSDGDFVVSLSAQDFTESDKTLFLKFGEPKVNVGGEYGVGDDPEDIWELPDDFKFIRSQMSKISKVFLKTEDQAEQKAEAYLNTMLSRVTSTMQEVRALQDSFSDEYALVI